MDISDFTDIILSVKTPLSYLVLVTLLTASLCYYFFKESKPHIKLAVFTFYPASSMDARTRLYSWIQ
jgi:hypothetical protein